MILAVNIGNTNVRVAIGKEHPTHDAVAFWDQISANCGGCSAATSRKASSRKKSPERFTREDKDFSFGKIPGPDGFLRFVEEQFGSKIWAKLDGCIIASVVPEQTHIVAGALEAKLGRPPKRVDPKNCPGLDLSAYKDTPGEDRVVCCVGALLVHAPPLILIDFGTATTVNVIDAQGRFLGGAILAGLHISLEALAGRTAQLPLIEELSSEPPLIGSRTRESMVSGTVLGEAFAAEGYVTRIKKILGADTPVIVTGGHAPVILPHCAFEHTHAPNLLLSGLFALYGQA